MITSRSSCCNCNFFVIVITFCSGCCSLAFWVNRNINLIFVDCEVSIECVVFWVCYWGCCGDLVSVNFCIKPTSEIPTSSCCFNIFKVAVNAIKHSSDCCGFTGSAICCCVKSDCKSFCLPNSIKCDCFCCCKVLYFCSTLILNFATCCCCPTHEVISCIGESAICKCKFFCIGCSLCIVCTSCLFVVLCKCDCIFVCNPLSKECCI